MWCPQALYWAGRQPLGYMLVCEAEHNIEINDITAACPLITQ